MLFAGFGAPTLCAGRDVRAFTFALTLAGACTGAAGFGVATGTETAGGVTATGVDGAGVDGTGVAGTAGAAGTGTAAGTGAGTVTGAATLVVTTPGRPPSASAAAGKRSAATTAPRPSRTLRDVPTVIFPPCLGLVVRVHALVRPPDQPQRSRGLGREPAGARGS